MWKHAAIAALVMLLHACGSSGPSNASGSPTPEPVEVPAIAPEPADTGPYTSSAEDYDFGRMTVSDEQSGASYETDIHGYIRVPQDAPGPFPVLLFQHGRHQTCETGIGQLPIPVGDDNCPDLAPIITPANSYLGYDYLAETMASHGYAVISIDTNDINDNDGSSSSGDAGALARGELILRHLDLFRDISRSGGHGFDALQGQLDFTRVGIMGHSRGGEGVDKAAMLNATRAEPHALRAVFALAPTDYNGQVVTHAAYATLLPYCDGDVENLMGAFVFDASRYADTDDTLPKFQILAMGANHNYFNTIWTSDDWTIHGSGNDPHCGQNAATNARDTPEGQRALGAFFIASFFRYFVGDEVSFGAYWTGRSAVPASACPDGVSPCDARYHLSVQPGAARRLLIDATPTATATLNNALGLSVRFEQFADFGVCTTAGGADGSGCAVSQPTFSTADQIYLQWTASAQYISELGALDARSYDTLSLRVGVSLGDDANHDGQDFRLVLSDTHGARVSVSAAEFSSALFYPPGDPFDSRGAAKTTLNAVRVPLSAFTGVDLGALQTIELVFDRSDAGTLQITDLMLQQLLP
jgi:hypothetical protein